MKKTKKYNKLVRDKIPEILKQKGIEFIIYTADDQEYSEKLVEKLKEEVEEFVKDSNEEELADILEVLNAIIETKGFSKESIETIKDKKISERGGFSKRIILEETTE